MYKNLVLAKKLITLSRLLLVANFGTLSKTDVENVYDHLNRIKSILYKLEGRRRKLLPPSELESLHAKIAEIMGTIKAVIPSILFPEKFNSDAVLDMTSFVSSWNDFACSSLNYGNMQDVDNFLKNCEKYGFPVPLGFKQKNPYSLSGEDVVYLMDGRPAPVGWCTLHGDKCDSLVEKKEIPTEDVVPSEDEKGERRVTKLKIFKSCPDGGVIQVSIPKEV